MNYVEWSLNKQIHKYKNLPDHLKNQIAEGGMPHEEDIVVTYPDDAYIIVFGDGYCVSLGNDEKMFPVLRMAEDFLWDNWSQYSEEEDK